MRILATASVAFMLVTAPVAAQDAATVEKIMAMLAEMQCEMDPDDIEVEDGGYELDDVFCHDGQYDIELDTELNVVGKRKE